jgi:low affinity Fe/Cu permease
MIERPPTRAEIAAKLIVGDPTRDAATIQGAIDDEILRLGPNGVTWTAAAMSLTVAAAKIAELERMLDMARKAAGHGTTAVAQAKEIADLKRQLAEAKAPQ